VLTGHWIEMSLLRASVREIAIFPPLRPAARGLSFVIRSARSALALLAALLLVSCYDPNPIESVCLSPDGRHLALKTVQGELGVSDLASGDATLRLIARRAGRGMAWSPDSTRLAYVEQPPDHPSALRLLNVAPAAEPRPLLESIDWKADPIWLDDRTLAYLSDAGAEAVNLWTLDLKNSAATRLLDRPADISRLWGYCAGGALIFQSAESGAQELYTWRPGLARPIQLTRERAGLANVDERAAAFSADGRAVAYSERLEGEPPVVVWFDLDKRQELDRLKLKLKLPARALAALDDGRVAIGQDQEVLLWQPAALWYRRTLTRARWADLPLEVLAPWRRHGLAVAGNENILMLADPADHLEAGRPRARRIEDMLALAYAYARQGHPRPAGKILKELRGQPLKSAHDRYLVAMGWGVLARLTHDWRAADRSLGEAAQSAAAKSPEAEAAWLERLCLAFFDARDLPLSVWVLGQLPPDLRGAALPLWLAQLTKDHNPAVLRDWMQIGGALRGERTLDCAAALRAVIDQDNPTTASLQGLSLILTGAFEPLGDVGDRNQKQLAALMSQPPFQRALLAVSHHKRPSGLKPSEARVLLLMQWVRQGDFGSARAVMREAMDDPNENELDTLDMLRQYLTIEEADRWQQRAVTDVVLEKDIAGKLEERLKTPASRLLLKLAQAKDALIEGNLSRAQDWLNEARAAAKDTAREEDEEGVGVLRQAHAAFLLDLFQAKIYERRADWPHAIDSYRACLDRMRQEPGAYEIIPYEMTFSVGLIQQLASRDPDLLQSYLRIMRGMGDPLVNPSHEAGTVATALMNIQTLRRVAPETFIAPYLAFSEGMSDSLLEKPWRALHYLRRARELGAPPTLLQRILLEEAALRDTLGQHALAARTYQRILSMNLPVALRASATLSCLESELACGAIRSPLARLNELLKGQPMPEPWRAWLRLQLGVESSGAE